MLVLCSHQLQHKLAVHAITVLIVQTQEGVLALGMAESIVIFHHFLTQVALHLIATMDLVQTETAELATIHMVLTNHTVILAHSHQWVPKGLDLADS